MSQFWHAHWGEDAYKPGLLGNWQVPNWHPKWPCVRHCVTTSALADKSGRLLPDKPRSKRSPWGDFKGTWELPVKINRKLAQKLSAPPEHKLAAWRAHKLHYEGPCGFAAASPKVTETKTRGQAERRKSPVRIAERTRKPNSRSKKTVDKIKGKKTEATVVKKEGKTLITKKATNTVRSPEVSQVKKVSKDRGEATEDEDKKTVVEEAEYGEEKTITEEPEYEEERTVTDEPEYQKDETAKEPSIVRADRKRPRRAERPECFCVNELDSRPPVELAPKATRNICTIHQRLRL